jgi:enoyl-[acyl-carrier protein] reductase I
MANNILKGKKGIIFGALDEKSIAWKTAQKCYEEGAQLVLSNAPVAYGWERSISWRKNVARLL